MYELQRQQNLFHVPSSEMNFYTHELSKSWLSDMANLSDVFRESSYYCRPLFTANEPFPNFIENSAFPKDASDLLFHAHPKMSASSARKVGRVLKSNKRLLKKIECTLEFVQSLKTGPPIQQPSPNVPKLLASGEEVAGGLQAGRKRRVTDEELGQMLEGEKRRLLTMLGSWTAYAATHAPVIDAAEGYRKLVSKCVRRQQRRENPVERLRSLLIKAKNACVADAHSVPSNNFVERQEKHGLKLIKKKNIVKKLVCTWAQINLYFLGMDQDIKSSLDRLALGLPHSEKSVQFLNIVAISQLSAIAKMLQYCLDNGVTVAEFMNDRTYQKIKARLKQMEELALGAPLGTAKERLRYPSLEEIPFLLSLRNGNIESIISGLKQNITSPHSVHIPLKCEEELREVATRNKRIAAKISERIEKAKEAAAPKMEIEQTTCRKRCTKAKKHERKKPKRDSSESDTNTTPKEHSLKTTVQPLPPVYKQRFKVLKFHNGCGECGRSDIENLYT